MHRSFLKIMDIQDTDKGLVRLKVQEETAAEDQKIFVYSA